MNLTEAVRRLGRGRRWVSQQVGSGRLPAARLGREAVISEADVARLGREIGVATGLSLVDAPAQQIAYLRATVEALARQQVDATNAVTQPWRPCTSGWRASRRRWPRRRRRTAPDAVAQQEQVLAALGRLEPWMRTLTERLEGPGPTTAVERQATRERLARWNPRAAARLPDIEQVVAALAIHIIAVVVGEVLPDY
jgi:hypothetical protein